MFRLIPDHFFREPGEPRRIPRDQCVFVGIHLGADTCTAAALTGDGDENLYFDAAHTQTVLPVTLERGAYRRFFRLPGDEAKECYGGDWTKPSYEALTQRFFRDTVASLLEHNPETFAGKRRILLCVSHPTSPRWYRAGKNYRDTLQSALDIPGWEGKLFVLPFCAAQGSMAALYAEKTIRTHENILIVDTDGERFSATAALRGCRNYATAAPGKYHPYLGTLTDTEPEALLRRAKEAFSLDRAENRLNRVILTGTVSAEEAIHTLFPGVEVTCIPDLSKGLAFGCRMEYLKGILSHLARDQFPTALNAAAAKLRLALTEPAADAALEKLTDLAGSWFYNPDAQSYRQAVLDQVSFDFPYHQAHRKFSDAVYNLSAIKGVRLLEDFSGATKTFLEQFALDDPTDQRKPGSRPKYSPSPWNWIPGDSFLQEQLAPHLTALTTLTPDPDDLFGAFKSGSFLGGGLLDAVEPDVKQRGKLISTVNARKETIRLEFRRDFDIHVFPAVRHLSDTLHHHILASLESYLIQFTPYVLQYEEKPNPEGVLQNVTNG